MNKISAAEQTDRANAFEVGFAKAAHDRGLTEEQYNAVRAYGIRVLQKQAADGEIKAQPETNAKGPAGESAQHEKLERSEKKATKPTPGKAATDIVPGGKGCK